MFVRMKSRKWFMVVSLCLILLITACGMGNNAMSVSNTDTSGTSENVGSTTNTATPDVEEDPYFGKFDPPIEVTTVRSVDSTLQFPEGDSIDDNVWTRSLEEQLGIIVNNDWVVDRTQLEQRMNVSIASGNLPQIVPVNAKQLQQLYEADHLMDLTEIYEKYASPFTKEIMNQDGPNALNSATFEGKLMAIPHTGSSMDGTPLLWVRRDWLQKLDLPEPETMEDLLAISTAFTTQDPDGNGADDTIGLLLFRDLYGGFADLKGFFNGHHAYPQIWIEGDNGELVYGSIQPEMKTALAVLQEMYERGEIDREFGVKDQGKAAEMAASSKVGMTFGGMGSPISYFADSWSNDGADWHPYPLVSTNDQQARPQVGFSTNTYYAVMKGTEHPEALLKAINLFTETGWGESTTTEHYAEHFNKDGINRHPYMPFAAWPARKNLDIHLHVVEALANDDPSILNPEEVTVYERIVRNADGTGESSDWARERIFGEEGAFTVINDYVDNNTLIQSEYFVAPTETMVARESTLNKMELEVFTKIILGDPLDTFDQYVENWKSLGGDEITQEVNDWYNAR